MPQLDLIRRPGLRIEPHPGRTEPLLWVDRLVIWSEPGVVVRDIALRPGLNIVWSPDPADRGIGDSGEGPLGHGSGKTLFCRLLRYCLGEESFAPAGLRDRIAYGFKDGMVGARVRIAGTPWAVLRSIGIDRWAVSVPGGDLDEIASGAINPTGMAPFMEAVRTQVLSDAVAALMPGVRSHQAWLIALAWLTRDQECRFSDMLDWRAASPESGSPARGLSATSRLDALRALVGAIAPEEHELRREVGGLERARSCAEREVGHREWEVAQKRTHLATALHLREEEIPPGALAVDVFKKAARAQLARAAKVDPSTDLEDLDALRAEYEVARNRADALHRELSEIQARIPEIERLVSSIKGEMPGLSYEVHEAELPVCPVCEVPIDRALAEGCKLSHKLADLDVVKARRAQRQRDLDREMDRLSGNRRDEERLTAEHATARQHAEKLRERLTSVERARDARKDEWYGARRRIDDAERLGELLQLRDKAVSEVQRLAAEIEAKRGRAAAYRDEKARVLCRVTQMFDAIVRHLAGPGASGHLSLDGNGLHLTIDLGGERSTAAIDSLKVLAFDLAVLCVSIEGATHLPAFLLHDSPREADLGLSVYHRLFRLARSLEQIGEQALFQYIVTTTTRPPDELVEEPWLRLTLEGSPATRRLLGRDL